MTQECPIKIDFYDFFLKKEIISKKLKDEFYIDGIQIPCTHFDAATAGRSCLAGTYTEATVRPEQPVIKCQPSDRSHIKCYQSPGGDCESSLAVRSAWRN